MSTAPMVHCCHRDMPVRAQLGCDPTYSALCPLRAASLRAEDLLDRSQWLWARPRNAAGGAPRSKSHSLNVLRLRSVDS